MGDFRAQLAAVKTGEVATMCSGMTRAPLSATVPHTAGMVTVPENVVVVLDGVAPVEPSEAVKEMSSTVPVARAAIVADVLVTWVSRVRGESVYGEPATTEAGLMAVSIVAGMGTWMPLTVHEAVSEVEVAPAGVAVATRPAAPASPEAASAVAAVTEARRALQVGTALMDGSP